MNLKAIKVFLLGGVIALTSCKGKSSKNNMQAGMKRPYPVVNVEEKDVKTFSVFPAILQGKNNNLVRAKTTGYINRVLVEEGQRVKKGQQLFDLETNVEDQNANSLKASIKASEARVKTAEVEVGKLIPLVEKNIISVVQLETAKANLAQAKAQLAQAKAAYQGIIASINYSRVVSPINGVVGKINYREGSLVSPQTPLPLTTVSDIGTIYAYFTVNEKQYFSFFNNVKGKSFEEKISKMPAVNLELADGSIYEYKGKVAATTGEINPGTGTIQIRVDFKNNGLLRNGNTGKIKVPRIYEKSLVVPESATYEQQGHTYVYAVKADSVINTVVTVKDRVNNLIVVEKGLNKQDVIVAQGVSGLRKGVKIIPQKINLDSLVNIKVVK